MRFYVAEIAMAIDYLHSKRIVHRDLKPDNILLDERGHAHITDFNIAVHFSERKPLTGVAGSMAYMAPEVLTKRGYSAPVDFWSLGILAFELLFVKRPFRGKTNSALTNSILHEALHWPDDATERCSTEGMQAVRGFLERDPNKRLGYRPGGGGFEDIKAHPWFAGIDWDALYHKQVVPPFEPDVSGKRAEGERGKAWSAGDVEQRCERADGCGVAPQQSWGQGGGVGGLAPSAQWPTLTPPLSHLSELSYVLTAVQTRQL